MSHNHCSDFIAFLSGHDHKNCTRQLHKTEHCVIESFERTIKSCGQIQEVLLPAQLIHETENKAIFVVDSDRKVNRNMYPDAVRRDRMRLIDPKSGQLEPIHHCCLVEEL